MGIATRRASSGTNESAPINSPAVISTGRIGMTSALASEATGEKTWKSLRFQYQALVGIPKDAPEGTEPAVVGWAVGSDRSPLVFFKGKYMR